MMQFDRFDGLVAAAHTPFHADGSLNLEALPRQAEHLLAQGLAGVFITGTTGECHSLTLAERVSLTERWADLLRGTSLRLVVQVGHLALPAARELAALAQRVGAHAISAMAPCYFKPGNVEALIAWCAEVAAAAPALPFYFYDIPDWTGVRLSMPAFLEQGKAPIPTLVGIKFTNSDLMQFQQCLHAESGAFEILFGRDECLLAAWALGGRGAVGSTYNFAAPLFQRLHEAFEAGDVAGAGREQYKAVELVEALAAPGYLAASKWLMERLGVPVGPPRSPLQPLDAQAIGTLEQALARLGWPKAATP